MLILAMLAVPLAGLVLSTAAARRRESLRDGIYLLELLAVFALAAAGFVRCLSGDAPDAALPGVCGLGLRFRLDGYEFVVSFAKGAEEKRN